MVARRVVKLLAHEKIEARAVFQIIALREKESQRIGVAIEVGDNKLKMHQTYIQPWPFTNVFD
jgi:hypothetical protein